MTISIGLEDYDLNNIYTTIAYPLYQCRCTVTQISEFHKSYSVCRYLTYNTQGQLKKKKLLVSITSCRFE